MKAAWVLGLDFGGSKLAAGIIDLQQKKMICVERSETQIEGDAQAQVAAMLHLAQALPGIGQVGRIGVCFGGPVQQGRILASFHQSGWEEFPLAARLQMAFGVERVEIANDAKAVALAEAHFGAGQGVNSLLYVTVSTGIGGGIVRDGKIEEGAHGLAGEIGHLPMQPGGAECACGKRGCLEALASGRAIARRARERLDQGEASKMSGLANITARVVAEQAQAGDDLAVVVIEEAAGWLGQGVAAAVNLLDVERVVLGGGVARAGRVWWGAVERSYRLHLLRYLDVPLAPSGLGDFEGVWGAAALVM